MAFKFPNVYDAMYAKSVAKKNAIPGITKEDYNKGIKEATFLALRSTVPYTIETFTNKDDIFQGEIYGAKSQEQVSEILKRNWVEYFPSGKVNKSTESPVSQQSISKFLNKKSSRSFKAVDQFALDFDENNPKLMKWRITKNPVEEKEIYIPKDILFGHK